MTLEELYNFLLERKNNPKPGSYTNSLFDAGLARMAQKVGEEGVEVAVAALAQNEEPPDRGNCRPGLSFAGFNGGARGQPRPGFGGTDRRHQQP